MLETWAGIMVAIGGILDATKVGAQLDLWMKLLLLLIPAIVAFATAPAMIHRAPPSRSGKSFGGRRYH
jgi:hypothetical protein